MAAWVYHQIEGLQCSCPHQIFLFRSKDNRTGKLLVLPSYASQAYAKRFRIAIREFKSNLGKWLDAQLRKQ